MANRHNRGNKRPSGREPAKQLFVAVSQSSSQKNDDPQPALLRRIPCFSISASSPLAEKCFAAAFIAAEDPVPITGFIKKDPKGQEVVPTDTASIRARLEDVRLASTPSRLLILTIKEPSSSNQPLCRSKKHGKPSGKDAEKQCTSASGAEGVNVEVNPTEKAPAVRSGSGSGKQDPSPSGGSASDLKTVRKDGADAASRNVFEDERRKKDKKIGRKKLSKSTNRGGS